LVRAIALVLLVAAALFGGFGILIWSSIPTSDTQTFSLLLFGLPFVAGGVVLASVAWILLRWGRSQP
jgi:hypothetical protein